MSRKKTINFDFEEVFERVKKAADIRSLVQLAEIIDVTQQAVSLNKKKNIFPLEWAYIISEQFNLELNWLVKGEEKAKEEIVFSERTTHVLNEIERWLNKERANEPKIIDWFDVEFKEKFPKFAEWKRKAEIEQKNNSVQIQKVI
jgi:hypothetical protein